MFLLVINRTDVKAHNWVCVTKISIEKCVKRKQFSVDVFVFGVIKINLRFHLKRARHIAIYCYNEAERIVKLIHK